MPVGRPTKYKEEYCEEIVKFFSIPITEIKLNQVITKNGVQEVAEEEACELPQFIDFAMSIGVCVDTLHEWASVHPAFSEAYKKAKKLQERCITSNAMKNRYNPVFSMFMLKCNHGYNDKASSQVDHTGEIKLSYNLDDE